jgi:hypothetical protein
MHPKEIFIKKWHKLLGWWQKYALTVIALCALLVSLYSVYLSRQDFIATHRPYVYAISRQTKENGKTVMDLNTVLIGSSNAPAIIISQEFYYLVVETKGNGEEIIRKTEYQREFPCQNILHPSEQPRNQVTILHDFRKKALGLDPEIKLRRRVRINYKELSSDRTYFFEGNWDYNRDYDLWEDKNMFGN